MIAEILSACAGTLAFVFLVGVPGWFISRTIGLGSPSATLFALPTGIGAYGIATFVFGLLGLRWGWWVPVILVLLGVGGLWIRSRRQEVAQETTSVPLRTFLIVGAVLIFAAAQILLLLPEMVTASAVQHFGDAQYHLYGTKIVEETGNTNPFGALSIIVDPAGETTSYYPVLYHALAALMSPVTGISFASNALLLFTGAVVWPVGLAAMVIAYRPKSLIAPVIAIASALLLVVFPGWLLFGISLGPFGLALVMLPSGVAAFVNFTRTRRLDWLIAFAVFFLGALAAQPSGALLFAVPILAWALVAFIRWFFQGISGPNPVRTALLAAAIVVVAAVGLVAVLNTPYIRGLSGFQRGVVPFDQALGLIIFNTVGTPLPVWLLVVGTLVVAATALALRSSSGTTGFVAFAGFLVLWVASNSPEGMFRSLSAPWWKDPQRLAVPVLMYGVIFASIGAELVLNWILRKLRTSDRGRAVVRVGVSVLALILAAVVMLEVPEPFRSNMRRSAATGYSLNDVPENPLTEDKVEVLEKTDDFFEPGETILGSPQAGVGLLPVYSDLTAAVPMPSPMAGDQTYLMDNFNQIHEDPKICELVDQYNIAGFLESEPVNESARAAQPGIYDVDTSVGFEELYSVGDLTMYRVTACD